MKLFKKTDRFFQTPKQRWNWLVLLFCLFCLWECGWMIYAGFCLVFLDGYDSLFSMAGQLDFLKGSFFVRLLLNAASMPYVSFDGILEVFFQSCSWNTAVVLLLGIYLYINNPHSKAAHRFAVLLFFQIVGIFAAAVLALSSSSLSGAVDVLKWFGIYVIILQILMGFLLIFQAVRALVCIQEW